MSSFTYPGKDRLAPRLRRLAGGVLLTAMLVAAVMLIKPLVDPKVFDALLSLTPLSKEKFEQLVANPWAGLFVLVGMSWLLSKWVAVEVLEFHLFPWFDAETLRAVTEKTGLLHWIDFEDSPAHEASQRLREWLSQDVHDGAWLFGWVVRGRPALKEKAFSYALLIGPNGVGKSQMAREVAREKRGVRSRDAAVTPNALVRAYRSSRRWAHRILPRAARLPDEPWHVGEVIALSGTVLGDWSERLKLWRPAAPTVLILDDVSGAMVREAIDIIDKNSGQFWYSVKLVIVDQFIPSKLDLEPIGRSRRDNLGREIPVFAISDVRWGCQQARRALSGGVWVLDVATGGMRFDPADDVSQFWQADKLEPLCLALDGNPLMLAEAAVWLAARNARGKPYRTVAALLKLSDAESFEEDVFDGRTSIEYRVEIEHRILQERIDEVFTSHLGWARDVGLDETAVVEALCCASLAGGAPLAAFGIFDKVQAPRLEKWIVRGLGPAALLPAVGSWPVSQVFIERSLDNYRSLSIEALARRALAVNPAGLGRQLTRGGRVARQLFDEIARLESDGDAALPFVLNLFEIAAARAIWADLEAVPQALAAIEKLPTAELPRAQAALERLGAYDGRVPDVHVAALLLSVLGARRFAEAVDWDWEAWNTFHLIWTRWLRRSGSELDFLPSTMRFPMMAAAGKLYEMLFAAASKLDDADRAFELLSELLENSYTSQVQETISSDDKPSVNPWPNVFRRLFLLRGLVRDAPCPPDVDGARRRFETLAAEVRGRLPQGEPYQRAYVEANVLYRRAKAEMTLDGTLADVEKIGAATDAVVREFPHNRLVLRQLAFSRYCVLRKFRETKTEEGIWGRTLAEQAEAACSAFLADERCLEAVIWCWAYALEIGRIEDEDCLDEVMSRMSDHAKSFCHRDLIQAALAKVIGERIHTLSQLEPCEALDARLLALASRLESITCEFPEYGDVQWLKLYAWEKLTWHWVFDKQRGLRNNSYARASDQIARPFPFHLGIQQCRLAIWRNVASYESRHGSSPGDAERITRRITWAAETFRGNSYISSTIALSWESAVYGWRRDPRAWATCELAVKNLESWAEAAQSSDAAVAQLAAWDSLMVVHQQRRDFDACARVERDALDRVETARAAYPDDERVAEYSGYLIASAALNRRECSADIASIEDMAKRVADLSAHFPSSHALLETRGRVDRLLHSATTKAPASQPRMPKPELILPRKV